MLVNEEVEERVRVRGGRGERDRKREKESKSESILDLGIKQSIERTDSPEADG